MDPTPLHARPGAVNHGQAGRRCMRAMHAPPLRPAEDPHRPERFWRRWRARSAACCRGQVGEGTDEPSETTFPESRQATYVGSIVCFKVEPHNLPAGLPAAAPRARVSSWRHLATPSPRPTARCQPCLTRKLALSAPHRSIRVRGSRQHFRPQRVWDSPHVRMALFWEGYAMARATTDHEIAQVGVRQAPRTRRPQGGPTGQNGSSPLIAIGAGKF
jgi:hypothetical protein